MRLRTSHACLAAAALWLASVPAKAQPGAEAGCPNIDPNLSIAVGADESEFQKLQSRVVLQGNVTITQGVLNLFADEVIINYHSGDTRDKGTQGTITSLLAKGTVKFECEGDRAHGREAIYDVSKREIRLTGDVLLVREQNVLKGETLFIDLDTGNTTIEGGETPPGEEDTKDTRIKAVFTPDAAQDDKDDEDEKEETESPPGEAP